MALGRHSQHHPAATHAAALQHARGRLLLLPLLLLLFARASCLLIHAIAAIAGSYQVVVHPGDAGAGPGKGGHLKRAASGAAAGAAAGAAVRPRGLPLVCPAGLETRLQHRGVCRQEHHLRWAAAGGAALLQRAQQVGGQALAGGQQGRPRHCALLLGCGFVNCHRLCRLFLG